MKWPLKNKPAHECTECGQGFDDDPHLVKDRIVCGRCHDLLQPQCPYCGVYLVRKSAPKRRSTFKCKACGEEIFVEPSNWLYAGVYLNEQQAGYVGYVEQLDHWVFTIGSRDDYHRTREQLRKKFGGEPGIGDVIWGLMNQSVVAINESYERRMQEIRRTFGGRVPCEMALTKDDKVELQDLRELMDDFRAFEKEMRANAKKRKQKKKAGQDRGRKRDRTGF